jgi:hypothetical protein
LDRDPLFSSKHILLTSSGAFHVIKNLLMKWHVSPGQRLKALQSGNFISSPGPVLRVYVLSQ